MKLIKIVIVFVCFNTPNATAETLFSPAYCEFIVEFPSDYYTQTNKSAGGNTTTAARASINGTLSLAAECWEDSRSITLDEFSEGLQSLANDRGFSVSTVSINKNGTVPVITLTATAKSQGKIFHVKMISYFGSFSRMDLFIVDIEMAGKFALKFRNSVRIK